MKNSKYFIKIFFSLFFIFSFNESVFAKGNAEIPPDPLNKEWVFAVTAFDTSALPASSRSIGGILQKLLVLRLKNIGKRKRSDEEYAFYSAIAREKNAVSAAKTLADKRKERDNLLFQGNPSWKYKKELAKYDKDIEKLEESFRKADAETPVIADAPLFSLIDDNKKDVFPKPPEKGAEYLFCAQKKADGFLIGSLSMFHNRLYLTIKIYALYKNSFIYEDSLLFSIEDAEKTADEIASGLIEIISGAKPALLTVRADPPDADIFINEQFAGSGETTPLEYPPGTVTAVVSAKNYQTISAPIEIGEGEKADVQFTLPPLLFTPLSLSALVPAPREKSFFDFLKPNIFEEQGASVYQGALYVGQTPLTLDIQADSLHYFNIEKENTAGTVIVDKRTDAFTVKTRVLPEKDEKPVEKARDSMYMAYGLFWIALPLAIVTGVGGDGGIAGAAKSAFYAYPTQSSADRANMWSGVSIGATIVAGAALAGTIFYMVKYFTTANKNSPKLIKK